MSALKERPGQVRGRVLRTRGGLLSVRLDSRTAITVLGLALAVFAAGAVSMTSGDYPLSVGEVVKTLFGFGDAGTEFIVTTLRLPRLLTALLVGGALAVSGAILQSLTNNSLGSPDIVGFTEGSATGALLVIVIFHGGMLEVAAGALAAGLVTALVVALLAFKGGVQGFRLILIGIGTSAMLVAANSYLITRASVQDAYAAQAWLVGGLNGRGWEHVVPVAIALIVLLPLGFYYGTRLSLLEMGDDSAKGLGVPVERSRLVLIGVSVGLCAVATAAAGPIAFVALAAPQLAKRLTRSSGPGLTASALMGALLLVVSDLATQRLFPEEQLPVGVATGAIGGIYLIWLLSHEWRRGRG
ncbi:FecCD family ABC transporter permease [Amycolatopsis sp. H20-H5]|uniref:FecCD family ABC transporter permease n=1 Tax=Amycolatopsis sp. H20-H5 TaxID=3046309 RepID=UPI002DB7FE8D|nr:iron chelate uptake ABC transporter family permease subunit [Amycolatopsis sp. H20-H5]MEC3976617.1 iron chelate uptake ABC transporter family permease subunit [Amycolatopsis sp. H20-H5]